ncbi:sialoadhesin-like isoform X3 [Dermochelys coriacea]|uniref:sialoadhesin-like isoform X3 n=1 Tax=Dermochelys coriacea TaxID=27794 RepID=UPI001CA97911|nr:sialoadhesin-like isoform X3 [Dermochelys coriacea]
MALVLVPAFCLLSGAYAQEWSVKFTPGPLVGWTGSCVTIPCSFTYPAGWTVSAVIWIQDRDQTIYHRDEARVHARFKGRTRYLGDLQHNCSLRVAGLRPSDQGTYRFRFEVVGYGKSDGWWSKSEQQLMVSAPLCQPALRLRMEPGPSLTCSMGATCPHRPSWYNRDGAWRSPGQTSGRSGATELQISPSQLDAGVALRCQVDGYRDECDSDESQPLGTVKVLRPAGKAALREGDGFTLRCQAAALQPVTGYIWYRGDVWLPGAGQDLRVEKAAVSDGGSYACGVWVSSPGWGYLSLSARESIEVQHAPTGVRIKAVPGISPQEGESVTLTCSYTSSLPAPNSYTWYRGGQQLEGSRQEMVLKSTTAEQAGEYRCQADNGIGQSLSPCINITITVRFTPPVRAPTYILGPSVALVLLLLVGLIGVIAWSKRQSKRQGLSSDPDQPGPEETPMSERIYENTQHYGMGKPARLAPPGPPSAPTEVCPGSPDGTGESHIYSQPMNIDRVLHVLSFPTGQRRSHPMRNSKDRPRIFTASWSLPKLVPTELCRNPDQPETPLHGRDLKHKEKPSLNGGRSQQGPQAPTFHCVGGCSSPGSVPDPTPTPSLPSRPHPCPAPPHLFPPPKYAASSLLSPVPRWAGGAGREGEALTGAAGECLTPRLGSSGHSSIGMNGARPPAGVMWPSLYWRT